MLDIVGNVTSIFALILVGFAVYRLGVLRDGAIDVITSLIVNITCPCLIVSSLYSKEITDSLFTSTVAVMVGSAVFYVFSTLVTWGFVKALDFKPRADWGVYIASVGATNSGFMGFPITKALFGNDTLYLMVMGNIVLNIYLMWFLSLILDIGSKKETPLLESIKDKLKNPLVISIFLGIAMMLLKIRPPQVIDTTVTMLSDVTIPTSMLLVGLKLGTADLRSLLKRNTLLISFLSMVIVPVLFFLLLYPMGFLGADVKIVLVLTAALPTAVLAVVLSQEYKKNSLLMSELVSLTTLISVATIPITVILLTAIYL